MHFLYQIKLSEINKQKVTGVTGIHLSESEKNSSISQ